MLKVNVRNLANRIRRYERAYYEELRQRVSRYDSATHPVPDFMRGPREIDAVLADDGALIVHWAADKDAFDFKLSDRTVNELVATLPGPVPDFRIELPLRPDGKAASQIMFGLQVHEAKGPDDVSMTGPVVWRSEWQRVEIYSERDVLQLTEESARDMAEGEVEAFVAGRLMGIEQAPAETVLQKLESIVTDFAILLDSDHKEEAVQTFLKANPILLEPSAVQIHPKHKLGAEYVTDFVIELPEREYILVEIEQPQHRLFTKDGDPAAALTHAQRQVKDWRQWVHDNIAYARNTLPGIDDPDCWVILGRRAQLLERDKVALARENREHPHIRVMTYDELLDRAKNHLHNLQRLQV